MTQIAILLPPLHSLKKHADRVALLQGEREFTYRQLDDWSAALAAQIQPNASQTVGILAKSSVEYFASLLAIWKNGAMAVPLQPAHPLEELDYIVTNSEVRQIFVHKACSELAAELRERHPAIEMTLISEPSQKTAFEPQRTKPSDGALMIYTSGTTGKPKGVVTTYEALTAQIEILLQAWNWSCNDRTLNVLPLHHVHGVVVVGACALSAGARMELIAKFEAEQVWKRISQREINVFMAVPTVYAKLVEYWSTQAPPIQKEFSEAARDLRLTVCGSAALPVPLFKAWERIAGMPLLERYGMTEIGMALSNPLQGKRKSGCVGQALPRVEVRLVDEHDQVITSSGQSGELQVRAPSVFKTYWRQPEVTRESFSADGWFKTGDVAERDTDGDYRILGRKSQDIIKTGGYKVSALEIENVILELPSIKEVAVLGVPDETWGERIAAWIVPAQPNLDVATVEDFLRSKLARYKIPTLWRLCETLPRNAMGKVTKSQLRKSDLGRV